MTVWYDWAGFDCLLPSFPALLNSKALNRDALTQPLIQSVFIPPPFRVTTDRRLALITRNLSKIQEEKNLNLL